MHNLDTFWTVQPPQGLLTGNYYRIEERFPPYYQGVEGQFPADPGHLGIVEVVKQGEEIIFIELNEITAPTYYNHLYQNISKRRSSFPIWQHEKPRMVGTHANITLGLQFVEKQMLEGQRLSGHFDLLASASGSAKKLIKIAAKLEEQIKEPSTQTLYSYSENFGYGLTGWLKVVIEDDQIVACKYDEVFADEPDDIVHEQLKKYFRQSKYDCPTYEDPFPPTWDRHAFLIGFRTLVDNLEMKVLATQNLFDLEGLPHTTGPDLGPLWDKTGNEPKALEMGERPIYPAWNNYLKLASVIADRMRDDGIAVKGR